MYYPKNQHMKVKRVHLHTQFHYRAASSLRCTTLFHYIWRMWNNLNGILIKCQYVIVKKYTYDIYLFF